MSDSKVVATQIAGTLNMTVDYATIQQRIDALRKFVQQYMVPGEDYGTIDGVNRPTLLKPGAEKLCDVYGLAVGEPIINKTRDDSKVPVYLNYEITTPLVSRADGRIIMHGVGSCNSYEKKYKYRWVFQNELPQGLDPQSLKTREVGKGQKKYTQYQIPNDEIDDLDNTLLKMAKKRSLIDAVLSATRSSALFTQDMEDMEGMEIKQQDNQKRNEQRQERGSQNQQSQGFAGSQKNQEKIKTINLMNDMKMSWDDLAEVASSALDRQVKRVMQDIKDTEWSKVLDKLQTMNQAS